MSDEELIAELRTLATNMFQSGHWGNDLDTTKAAADSIEQLVATNEALVKERDKYRDAFNTNCLVLRGTEERVERLEAALRELVADAEVIMNVPAECYAVLRAALKGADHE